MKIIASYSIKGGVGKTAASVNIAYSAAKSGQETLLVDLDPQGASSYYFRIGPGNKKVGKNFLLKKNRILRNVKGSNYKRLDVLPANLSYRNFDIMLNRMHKSSKRLRDILLPLKDEYDLIVLDCPPNITLLSENVFTAADMIVVPVIPTTLSERTLKQLLDFFDTHGYDENKLYPFFSMTQKNNRLHKDTIKKMSKKYAHFLQTSIPFTVEIERMGVHREPVLAYASKKSPAHAYRCLYGEIKAKLKK